MNIARSLIGSVILIVAIATPGRAAEVQRVISPGGIEAWLVEDHSNAILSLQLAFRGGAALDPIGEEGLANFAASLIDEGAGDLDSQAFQGRLEDLSISLSFSAGLDTFTGSLRTLIENRDAAFELLKLALTQPRFDPEPVERIRNQILAGLKRDAENPGVIANRVLRRLLYPEHPYGRRVTGTSESVSALTEEDLRQFVANHFARDNLIIGVVGDIDPEELARLLDQTFLALPAETASQAVARFMPQGEGDVVVIDKAVPQSTIVFGHAGLLRDDPDYYAAFVVNYILGGGSFASRLYEEVREKRGLAYSVYSYLGPLDHSALMAGGLGTQNAMVSQSLDIVREEWQRMAEDGPSEEELSDAKTYLTGSFPLRLSSTQRIASLLVGMQLEDLGIDYLDRRNDYINTVTIEDARRVAQRLLLPEELTVVIVGQPEGVSATRTPPVY